MMTRNGSLDVIGRTQYIIDCVFGRNVFHGNVQGGKVRHERFHNFFNENGFAIKNIRMGHFGMDAQSHPHVLHGLQRGIQILDICYTAFRIGRSARGIVLGRHNPATTRGMGFSNFFGRRLVGQIQSHEGFKITHIIIGVKTV
jgi:hypothetical protein